MKKSNFNNNILNMKANRNDLPLNKDNKYNPFLIYLDNLKSLNFQTGIKPNNIKSDAYYFPENIVSSGFASTVKNSYAIKLARTIIHNPDFIPVLKATSGITREDILSEYLSEKITDISPKITGDNNVLLIHLKQTILILRKTNTFNNFNNLPAARQLLLNYFQLYLQLLNSFWNNVKWNELFPSMPDMAIFLWEKRNVLARLMLREKSRFRIDAVSNYFSFITGIGKINDLNFISFMDFYFFTWLEHFGLITYLEGSDYEPVEIIITGHGRKILSLLAPR